MKPFNGTSNLNTIDGSGSLKGSAIGTEVCTVADGDPSMDLELMRRFAPENGISTKMLLTGQRKRAEPYQSILLGQNGPMVQPSGAFTVVNTSVFGSAEPSLRDLENGQGGMPGYRSRFPQLQSRPAPNQVIPTGAGGELRGIDVNDFDSKDPVSGSCAKPNPSILAPQQELDDRVNEVMKAYTSEEDLSALTLPFRGSNWAAENGIVPDNQGNIPVYSPTGQVISNLRAPRDAPRPLPPLTPMQRQLLAPPAPTPAPTPAPAPAPVPVPAPAQAKAQAQTPDQHPEKKKKNKPMTWHGYLILGVCALILLILIVLLIVFSSKEKSGGDGGNGSGVRAESGTRKRSRSLDAVTSSNISSQFDEAAYY